MYLVLIKDSQCLYSYRLVSIFNSYCGTEGDLWQRHASVSGVFRVYIYGVVARAEPIESEFTVRICEDSIVRACVVAVHYIDIFIRGRDGVDD